MSDNVERLHNAIRGSDGDTWRQLLDVMTVEDINTRDENGYTGLHWACCYNNVPAVAALLQTPGLEVDVQNSWGNTPVMLAVRCCNLELVQLLVNDRRVEVCQCLDEHVGTERGSEEQEQEILRMIQEERRRRTGERRDGVEEARRYLECPTCLEMMRMEMTKI